MNVTARRAVSVVGAVVLVAAVAMAAATPALAKKPGGNDKPVDTAFTIKTNLEGSWGFWGTFRAQGAIDDSGDASFDVWDYDVLQIWGDHGTMLIELSYGTFWILDADGAYSGLVGVTGTYTQKSNDKVRVTYPEVHTEWHLSQILEGSLPEE